MTRHALPLLVAGLTALAAACSPTVVTRGQTIDAQALGRIEPGVTGKREVAGLLGSPSTLGTFDQNAWYYVNQRIERRSFYQADVVQQEVVEVRFDDQGRVAAVDRHGLDDARAILPVNRETPTTGSELTFLQQLVGNVGRFNRGDEASGALGGGTGGTTGSFPGG